MAFDFQGYTLPLIIMVHSKMSPSYVTTTFQIESFSASMIMGGRVTAPNL